MSLTNHKRSFHEWVITRLESKSGRPFTWIDRTLGSFLLAYFVVTVALAVHLFFATEEALQNNAFVVLAVIAWLVIAVGWGVRTLNLIFSGKGTDEEKRIQDGEHDNEEER